MFSTKTGKTTAPSLTYALPGDILHYPIFNVLSLQDATALGQTTPSLFKLAGFQKAYAKLKLLRELTPEFLQLVAHGKTLQVEIMLKKNPELALLKSKVTDYSNRTFQRISGVQYASWAYDTRMLNLLLRYTPAGEKFRALQQLEALETHGTEHGKHYDFASLIVALQTYADNRRLWIQAQCVNFWIFIVGGAQCLVPAHVANEYCNPLRSFYPAPGFKDHLPRELKFYNFMTESTDTWFPLPAQGGLGVDFAFSRQGRQWL